MCVWAMLNVDMKALRSVAVALSTRWLICQVREMIEGYQMNRKVLMDLVYSIKALGIKPERKTPSHYKRNPFKNEI